jgi:hypothetical protein
MTPAGIHLEYSIVFPTKGELITVHNALRLIYEKQGMFSMPELLCTPWPEGIGAIELQELTKSKAVSHCPSSLVKKFKKYIATY